jgi:hypothetical protein
MFLDFKGGLKNNEEERAFERKAFYVVVMMIEKSFLKDDNWALSWPDLICSKGRSLLHEVGNYFDFAHHSAGKKNRHTLMYPRS